VLDRFLEESKFKRLEELLSEIALGNRFADQVAGQLITVMGPRDSHPQVPAEHAVEKIRISGAERGVLSFGNCCHPLPGDEIIGFLSSGKGIVVHRVECPNVAEFRKTPERIVAIEWDRDVTGDYRAELRIEVLNRPGVLATVAAAIADAGSNIENVEYIERDSTAATLLFAIEVKGRKHLADVMRRVRRTGVVSGVYRHPL
jgi:guanosine-3',5'-bis(diphosphate) 3'-pyrophosphohydrolase